MDNAELVKYMDWALEEAIEAAKEWIRARGGPHASDPVENSTSLFIETKNPLYAWQAFSFMSDADNAESLPRWISLFLEANAAAFMRLALHCDSKKAIIMLPQALGVTRVGRGGNMFAKFRADKRAAGAAIAMEKMETRILGQYRVVKKTAQRLGVNRKTIQEDRDKASKLWACQSRTPAQRLKKPTK